MLIPYITLKCHISYNFVKCCLLVTCNNKSEYTMLPNIANRTVWHAKCSR